MDIQKIKNINTKYLAKQLLYFNEIDSTQDEAQRLIKNKKAQNGTIIIANKQILGKGTHGRKWYTGEGENIAFSIILFPNCNINKFKDLTIIIAECILKSLKKLYNIEVQIKQPNDIVYNNLKLGGILTQSVTANEIVKNLIIGIGLNVNQLDFDDEIVNIATSLKKEFNDISFCKEDIICTFCKLFEKEFELMLDI